MNKLLLRSICVMAFGVCLTAPVMASTELKLPSSDTPQKEVGSFEASWSAPRRNSYSKVFEKTQTSTFEGKSSDYKINLSNALRFHNLMNSVAKQKGKLEAFRLAVLNKEISKARMTDFDTCNQQLLAPYFSDPKKVWKKLKEKMDDRIEEYNRNVVVDTQALLDSDVNVLALDNQALQVTSQKKGSSSSTNNSKTQPSDILESDNPRESVKNLKKEYGMNKNARERVNELKKEYGMDETEVKKTDKAEANVSSSNLASKNDTADTPFDVMSAAPEIGISFAILNDFYSNQDKWGARKTGSSLPLWMDQKYLYNKDIWRPKYQEIARTCEEQEKPLVTEEPDVSNEIKYDYYFYGQVVSAHNAFVKKAEEEGCVLSASMRTPPVSAPRPLPPVYEEITVIKDENGKLSQIYPQNPMNPVVRGNSVGFAAGTLWERYKRNGYKEICRGKGCEFDTYFEVQKDGSIKTKDSIDKINGNRLSRYLLYKEDVKRAENTYNGYIDDANELKARVEQIASNVGIKEFPMDINYLNEQDLNRLYEFLKTKKNEEIKKVEDYKNKDDFTEEESAYLKALTQDQDAELLITSETAKNYEEAIEEAEANQALVDEGNEVANRFKLCQLEGCDGEKGINYRADIATCLGQTDRKLVDISKVPIK